MNDQESTKYDVFISYAHADAQTDAGKKLIASFKDQINAVLQSAAGDNLVFLDSEALEWGDEWSSKIMECLQQCKVFVCLLSPNYQKSAYCKRERLMWGRKEIRLGRLRKGTHPVYYIRIDNEKTEELLISQADDSKPFFENIEQIREGIISEKIERVKKIAEKVKNKELVEEQANSVSFGFLHISPNFVGRLGELSELCELCNQRYIPIITGGAGVGKSELAVAYASGYAELYPQGRFMLHMEGVEDWNHAVVKMVEDNSSAVNSLKDLLELPEDYDKLPLEEKRKKAVQSLWKRSEDGRLLLILDNLDKLSLVSDNGLNKLLDGVGDLPENVDIIATSRNNNLRRAGRAKALSGVVSDYNGLPVLYEIDNLDIASAFELFCRINDDQFPFAKCNPEIMKDDVRREYDALMEIILYLKGHAWSLEIIAALMAENTDDEYTFQCKLEEIKQTTTGIAGDDSSSNLSPALTPEQLLQPTFDRIAAMDHGCKIGEKILELATVAAFFPPDMVSDEALLGYWKKYYTEFKNVGFDTGSFALEQLHALHLLNGEGSISKMHRLTRDVLLERLSEEDKLTIVKQMQEYWNDYHSKFPNMNLQQVKPWIGYAEEWPQKLSNLQEDEAFLENIINISHEGKMNNLFLEAEKLYSCINEYARKLNNQSLIAVSLGSLAVLKAERNQFSDAECMYGKSLEIYRHLAEVNPDRYDSAVASMLNNLAKLHKILNRLDDAEQEYEEVLSIRRRLAKSGTEEYYSAIASTLNDLANLHKYVNNFKSAECEYKEALVIRRHLAGKYPERYNFDLVDTLNSLAILFACLNQYTDAESTYKEALLICRGLAKVSPERFEFYVALTLTNLANLHISVVNYEMAEHEYNEALSICRSLAKTTPENFDSYIALILSNLANLHKDINRINEAEREYQEALDIRRRLSKISPESFLPNVAHTLNNLAILHSDSNLNCSDKAECEYTEALEIYRRLANKIPECYSSYVAMTLNNLANLHASLNRSDDAEREYDEALSIRRRLADLNHVKFDPDVAESLNNIAILHESLNYFDVAMQEYMEALSIYRQLSDNNPERFQRYVLKTEKYISLLYDSMSNSNDQSYT